MDWFAPANWLFLDLRHAGAEALYCDHTAVAGHDALDVETLRDRIVRAFSGSEFSVREISEVWEEPNFLANVGFSNQAFS